ncbi:conserved oligomeric Golgi complex subunit 1 [Planococcus citri]|uniref:conserved oligomeric Golgi complex subunit 1 n=1 Tax=Planococcus citri TaxID=170843 RepID=UPI0031F98AD7
MTSLERFSHYTHDELFEKYSVSEIRVYQNDLQKEVDKKKDELRVLVGEKYRDFIEVADRINLMNGLSKSIADRIQNISSSLTSLDLNLEDDHISKIDRRNNQDKVVRTNNTIAILIKLLIDIEEQIWIEISANKFITATTLLHLAVHVKTSLSLEADWNVDKKFPVVYELRNSILRFPNILTQKIESKIKVTNLSVAEACECLCTLTVLENLTCVEVIERFVNLRTETLKSILNMDNVTSNVKNNAIGSFEIIVNTFEILYRCFRVGEDENQGEYWIQMRNMTTPVCEPALSKVNLDFTTKFGFTYIPASVQNFKVKTSKSISTIQSSEYNQFLEEWLGWIRAYVKPNLLSLLDIIGSLKTLQVLKESKPNLPQDWPSIMEYFNQDRNLNLWNENYRPLITNRAKAVLSHQWDSIFKQIRIELGNITKDIAEEKTQEPENNLHWFLWSSFEEDLSEKISKDSQRSVKSLSIKSSGQSPNSGKMCLFIQSLVSDIMKEIPDSHSEDDDEAEQMQILKRHQQQCCLDLTEKLIAHVLELTNQETVSQNVIIFLARVLSGVATLCSSLKHCVLLLDDKGEKWSHINTKLQEESLTVWRKWSITASAPVLTEYTTCITSLTSFSLRIKYFPKWEKIKIKEENESGEQLETEILVPFQASFPVQKLLNSLTSICSETLPPRIIIAEMVENILTKILSLLENPPEISHQAIYVQYVFDLKYLTTLLIPVENDNLINSSGNTVSVLETKIDPVDLDILSSHLSQNVLQHVYKTQNVYGLLINNKSKLSSEQYTDNSDDPNVAYVGSTNIPWFPLLPSNVFSSATDSFKT